MLSDAHYRLQQYCSPYRLRSRYVFLTRTLPIDGTCDGYDPTRNMRPLDYYISKCGIPKLYVSFHSNHPFIFLLRFGKLMSFLTLLKFGDSLQETRPGTYAMDLVFRTNTTAANITALLFPLFNATVLIPPSL